MHRWSELFIPTLREAPAYAEVASHKFLVRSGYIRQLAAGIYSYLFLGNRSFQKITAIVREEMDRIGQEFYLPALHPRELWEASGRWAVMGEHRVLVFDVKADAKQAVRKLRAPLREEVAHAAPEMAKYLEEQWKAAEEASRLPPRYDDFQERLLRAEVRSRPQTLDFDIP